MYIHAQVHKHVYIYIYRHLNALIYISVKICKFLVLSSVNNEHVMSWHKFGSTLFFVRSIERRRVGHFWATEDLQKQQMVSASKADRCSQIVSIDFLRLQFIQFSESSLIVWLAHVGNSQFQWCCSCSRTQSKETLEVFICHRHLSNNSSKAAATLRTGLLKFWHLLEHSSS